MDLLFSDGDIEKLAFSLGGLGKMFRRAPKANQQVNISDAVRHGKIDTLRTNAVDSSGKGRYNKVQAVMDGGKKRKLNADERRFLVDKNKRQADIRARVQGPVAPAPVAVKAAPAAKVSPTAKPKIPGSDVVPNTNAKPPANNGGMSNKNKFFGGVGLLGAGYGMGAMNSNG
jgi:hypothetical protein